MILGLFEDEQRRALDGFVRAKLRKALQEAYNPTEAKVTDDAFDPPRTTQGQDTQ